jgi:hypothetical protein
VCNARWKTDRRSAHDAPYPAYETLSTRFLSNQELVETIPGNRSFVPTEPSTLVHCIVGGEEHLIGQLEVMLLSHWEG